MKNLTRRKKNHHSNKKGYITYIGSEAPQFEIRAFQSNTHFSTALQWHFEPIADYPKIGF